MAAPISRTLARVALVAWVFLFFAQAYRLYYVLQQPAYRTFDWLIPLVILLAAPLLILRYARLARGGDRNTGPGSGV